NGNSPGTGFCVSHKRESASARMMAPVAAQQNDSGDLAIPGELRGDDIVGAHGKTETKTEAHTNDDESDQSFHLAASSARRSRDVKHRILARKLDCED